MSDNIGQRIGAAGNQAATVLQTRASQMTDEQIADSYEYLVARFVSSMGTIQNTETVGAQVAEAFPGTTSVPPQQAPAPVQDPNPAHLVPAPQPQYQPQAPVAPAPQPAAIPGAADGDPIVASIWEEFFQDPQAFWDNRNGKRNPKAPDFKNKANGDRALWLNDKKNPSWVAQRLAAAGI